MGIAKPKMTDEELSRRKRAQARFSITGSTLGLTALSLKGGSATAKLIPKAERLKAAIPALKKLPPDTPKRLSDAATTAAIGGAGVGGIGGYNFAAYTKEEARRNHNQKVRKAMAGDSEGTEASFRLVKVPENKRTITRLGRTAAGAGIGAALGSGHGTRSIVGGSLLGAGLGASERVPKYKLKPVEKKKSKKISKRIEIGIYKGYDPEERRQRVSGAASGAGAVASGGLGYMAYKEGAAAKKTVEEGLSGNKSSYRRLATSSKRPGMTLKRSDQIRRAALRELGRSGKATQLKALEQGKKAAILGAGSLAAGAASAGLAIHANKRGRTYQTWY